MGQDKTKQGAHQFSRERERERYHGFFGSDPLLVIVPEQLVQEVNGLEKGKTSLCLSKYGADSGERRG